MTQEEYYTAPPDAVFEDIKRCAIAIWQTYDDAYGYATGKINAIKDIANVKDNAWNMVVMFDWKNKQKLLTLVQPETREMILRALES